MTTPSKTLNTDRIEASEEFIKNNNLSLGRSQKEILEAIAKSAESFLDFGSEVLIPYLDWENAKAFYKEEFQNDPSTHKQITSLEETVQDFLDYMVFAWGKAEDERGISASRSIQKLGTWLWLMGKDELSELIGRDELYNPYGAPALIAVCNEMGIPVPESLVEFSKHRC